MKQFRKNVLGNDVWIGQLDKELNRWVINDCGFGKIDDDDSEYFRKLVEAVCSITENVDFELNITKKTSITLHLDDEQLPIAKQIKAMLLEKFPDEIEQIGISGNELNLLDSYYSYQE